MNEYTVKLSDTEVKALSVDLLSIQEWLQDAITNKARQCIDRIILKHTDKQPGKLSIDDKLKIVDDLNLETRLEREKREARQILQDLERRKI